MRRLALVFLALAPACNCGTVKERKTNGIVVLSIPGAPDVTEGDTAMGFDEACLASPEVMPVTKPVTIKNSGQNTLQIKSIALTGPSAGSFTITTSPLPTSLAPLQQAPVNIAFAPISAGNQSATLVITTDDPAKGVVNVHLTGSGSSQAQAPQWSISCEESWPDGGGQTDNPCIFLSFPDTGVGSAAILPVHVQNTGCPPLQVTNVEFLAESSAFPDAGYAYQLHSPSLPASIPGGQMQDLVVDFTPTSNDYFPALMLVTTNAQNDPASADTTHHLPDGGPLPVNMFEVSVEGNGIQSQVSLTPNDCNFNQPSSACNPTQSGTAYTGTFLILNSGGQDLSVTSLTLANAGSTFSIQAPPTPFTVPANGQISFTVIYQSTNGQASNQLLLVSSGGSASATLEGGNPAVILTSPQFTLDFGDQTQGTYSPSAVLTVEDVGAGDLSVSGFNFSSQSGDGGCPWFAATPAPAFPVSIAPDAGVLVTLTHTPKSLGGTDDCTLSILSNDPLRDGGYPVELKAVTYVHCVPVPLMSPDGSSTYALSQHSTDQLPDGGDYVTVLSGQGSYSPGPGQPAPCTGGQSSGIQQWEWTLIVQPGNPATAGSTHLEPMPGATITNCKASGAAGCTDLVVSNSGSLSSPSATDSSVQLVIDPAYKGTNLYLVQLNVFDGSNPTSLESPVPDNLNLGVGQ